MIGYWRLFLASIILGFTIYSTTVLQTPELNYLYIIVVLFVVMHFLFGSVDKAYQATKKGNWEKAHQILSATWFPRLLTKRHQALYFLIKGMISLHQKSREEATTQLRKALHLKLTYHNDRALAQLNLAHLALLDKDKTMAKEYLIAAKQQQSKDPLILKSIQELEKIVKKQ